MTEVRPGPNRIDPRGDLVREAPRRKGRARSLRREPREAPGIQVHAHRGGAALAPENTMAAFERARDLGVDFFELDVHRCRTGELVVIHDADLVRVADVDARVADLSLRELQSIDVGSHFHPDYADQRIPTLVEVIEAFRGTDDRRGVRFNIEVKEETPRGNGSAIAVGELISSMRVYGDVIVSAFNPFALLRVRSRCRAPLGLLFPPEGRRLRDLPLKKPWASSVMSVYALHPRDTVATPELVRKAHLRGLAVNVWTVDDEARMRELAAIRVNGIITDRPDIAMEVVLEVDRLKGRPTA